MKTYFPKSRKKNILIVTGILIFLLLFMFMVRYFSLFWGVVVDRSIDIKKTQSGAINVLILGIGGGAHDGPNLTDTIILASIHPDKNTIDLISIPRDLYIPATKGKINRIYSDAQEKHEGSGMLLTKSVINAVTGIRPDYIVVIDFSGFVKLVDLLGGIEVDVENTLIDPQYPIFGEATNLCDHTEDGVASFSAQIATGSATEADIFPCRYSTLRVEKGTQVMDGELALQFVRSRHAQGSEGTDFARSKRQQLVIDAVRDKILSLGTLANPIKIFGMIDILQENIKTDIEEKEIDDFIKLAQKMGDAVIKNYVLDIGDESQERFGLLIHPEISATYNYQWVLAPRKGRDNFSEIKDFIRCVTEENMQCEITESGVMKTPQSSN